MYTPLDLYFLTRIVALWRSGENIASIDRILHTEERKTMEQTIRRCKKKRQVSHAVSACFHLVAHFLESHSLHEKLHLSQEVVKVVSLPCQHSRPGYTLP